MQWRDLPERFGPWKTVYEGHRLWSADGTWERVLQQVQAAADAADEIDWDIPVDSTIVRAPESRRRPHRPAAPRRKGCNVHSSADGRCRPLSLVITPGQRADCAQFTWVLEKIRVPRCGPGRPRKKPQSVAADKPYSYSNRPYRQYLRHRGIRHTIPEKSDSRTARLRKGSRGAWPSGFDEERYKKRNTVERAINRLKPARAVATH